MRLKSETPDRFTAPSNEPSKNNRNSNYISPEPWVDGIIALNENEKFLDTFEHENFNAIHEGEREMYHPCHFHGNV